MLNTMVDEVRRMPVLLRFGAGIFAAAAWHNGDNFTHSVQVLKEGFPMVNLRPGAGGTISFTQPGEYDYICTYHTQQMKGKVIVVKWTDSDTHQGRFVNARRGLGRITQRSR